MQPSHSGCTLEEQTSSIRSQVRDLKLVNSVNSMEGKRYKSVSKLRLFSYSRCFRIWCRCHSKERKQDHQDMVIPVVNDPVEHVIKSSRDAGSVNGLSSTMSGSQQLQAEDTNRQHNNPLVHQSPRWSNPRSISPLRTYLEAVSQEESQLDWRAHSRILQCQSRPPQPSCRVESQVSQDNQELQLETQDGSVQSVRSNSDGSVCISPQPSNDQLLHNQNELTPTRLESMEAKLSTVSFDFQRPIFLATWNGRLLESSKDAMAERVECDLNLVTSIPDFERVDITTLLIPSTWRGGKHLS
ncbi:hypothetical protein ACTFIV_005207 [Dictyostelium citrinum]